MKKSVLFLLVLFLSLSATSFGQSKNKGVEVLYFKANLACCKARACSALQSDVESVVAKYFAKENIEFKVIPIADETNKELVAKYNAKSQTVVIVKNKGKKETISDVSDIVHRYSISRNKSDFETELREKVTAFLR